jgi:hypothetical protein
MKLVLGVNILPITNNIYNFLGYRLVGYVGSLYLCGWTRSPSYTT